MDTNAWADWLRIPNATTDATLELPVSGKTLTVDRLHVAHNMQDGSGTVNHTAGSLDVNTLSLRPTGLASGTYNLSGGTVSATDLEVGDSTLNIGLSVVGGTALTTELQITPAGQIIIDGTAYEGLDGYFPVISASNLAGSLTNQISFVGFDVREPSAIIEDDGLWLRLIAEPSLSQRLCSRCLHIP
ncbi:hypothetical protein P4C99_13165 [Pontiellaceae bacterium B1224]|nr:hypothetical protein [Pontiellaceae bacterium B1224]